jgi:hypothetical protein
MRHKIQHFDWLGICKRGPGGPDGPDQLEAKPGYLQLFVVT